MSKNLASSTDQPFAINDLTHRFDFGHASTTEVCVFLSAGDCVRPPPFVNGQVKPLDYNNCTVRCWGYGYKGTDNLPQDHLEANYYTQGQDNQDTYRTKDGDSQVATDVWSYKKTQSPGVAADENQRAPVEIYGSPRAKNASRCEALGYAANSSECDEFILGFNPQGFVFTFAGKTEIDPLTGELQDNYGYQDGESEKAMFRGPRMWRSIVRVTCSSLTRTTTVFA